ncbi:MAG TPA: TlpA family protein disulfide reductase [Bacteroidetes bacterium]|nr:TlpA family protein disulfide reductase [Bacteroidota bacterium]
MKNWKQKIVDYYRKRSIWSLISDGVFAVLLVLLLIPATRRELVSRVVRLTMRNPVARAGETNLRADVETMAWPLYTAEGREILFSDLEGEVIFLNFWATWCPPCIAEMPSIQNLYNEYGNRVKFLLVTREEVTTVQDFLDKNGYHLPVFFQKYREPDLFESSSIPTTFILSRDGRLLVNKKGAARWDSRPVKRLLDELAEKEPERVGETM